MKLHQNQVPNVQPHNSPFVSRLVANNDSSENNTNEFKRGKKSRKSGFELRFFFSILTKQKQKINFFCFVKALFWPSFCQLAESELKVSVLEELNTLKSVRFYKFLLCDALYFRKRSGFHSLLSVIYQKRFSKINSPPHPPAFNSSPQWTYR